MIRFNMASWFVFAAGLRVLLWRGPGKATPQTHQTLAVSTRLGTRKSGT